MVWHKNAEGRYGANGAKGDKGEKVVKEYCNTNGIPYEERTDLFSQVHLKIDCMVDGVPVDVKTNFFKGFLAVECYLSSMEPGWIYTTKAEQIYGVDVDTNSIYRYNVSDMLEYVNKNRTRVKKTKKGDILLWVPVKTSIIEQIQ